MRALRLLDFLYTLLPMEELKPIEQLSKKERRAIRRQKKEAKRESTTKIQHTKRVITWATGTAFVTLLIGGFIWYMATRQPTPEGEIISRNGLHWHADLAIYVKGEKQEIPANIGIGAVHQPIHTHDEADVIHLEFQGQVRKTDITLGQFFKNWDKDIRSFGTNMRMTVNGKENIEYENYIMRDKDEIELHYE